MRIATIAGLLALASTAHAGYITLEPDDHAPGTNVSIVVPGVSLSSVFLTWDQDLQRTVVSSSQPVYTRASEDWFGNILATGADSGGFWERPDYLGEMQTPTLRVEFAFGISSIEFRWNDWECYSVEYCFDMPIMQIFDSHDNLIAACNFHEAPPSNSAGCTNTPLGLTIENPDAMHPTVWHSFYTGYSNPDADIAYAMIGNFQFVDQMRVQAPEPATLGLLGLGVLVLGLRRRRAR
jgi:hypothetical protein